MIPALLVLSALLPVSPFQPVLPPLNLPESVLPPLNLPQSVLDAEARRFAEAWARKDLGTLSDAMSERGIRLHLPAEEHQVIRPRQARAAIGSFLEQYAAGSCEVNRVSRAKGDDKTGFAEVRWTTRSAGGTEPVIFTIFVALVVENENWRVSEIRILF